MCPRLLSNLPTSSHDHFRGDLESDMVCLLQLLIEPTETFCSLWRRSLQAAYPLPPPSAPPEPAPAPFDAPQVLWGCELPNSSAAGLQTSNPPNSTSFPALWVCQPVLPSTRTSTPLAQPPVLDFFHLSCLLWGTCTILMANSRLTQWCKWQLASKWISATIFHLPNTWKNIYMETNK